MERIVNTLRTIPLLFTLLILVSTASCQQAPTTTVAPAAVLTPSPIKSAWEHEWEKLVTAARKEGKVVIYTSAGSEVRVTLSENFKRRYGIDTEWVTGRGAELVTKLLAERGAKLYLADLCIVGVTQHLAELIPGGMTDPIKPLLILPEVIDPEAWYRNKIYFADRDGSRSLCFTLQVAKQIMRNTNLVGPSEIKSYNDLLNPKWKGKIVLGDPTIPGAGEKWFHVTYDVMGPEYMRQFAKQEPAITRDERQAVEWTARGKYAIVIGFKSAPAYEFMAAGAPLEYMMPAEGTWISAAAGAMVLINKAPHPNAVTVFINWLLTREGQTVYSKAAGEESARVDVPADHIPPDSRRDPKIKYFEVENEEFAAKEPESRAIAKELFKDFLGGR